ncbi:HAD family phosphatase [soil metagenome]
MQNIKAIIFDLGGVLLNIDYDKTSKAFSELGVTNFDNMYSQAAADSLFSDLETGNVSQQEFCEHMRKSAVKELTDVQILSAWNALLLDFRIETLEKLKELKNKYKIFLLSNTNSIHVMAFTDIFNKNIYAYTFESLFDKIYFSNEIGFRKPDVAAYEYVLNENQLVAAETLFIDDSFQNIEAAEKAGLQTIFLKKGMKVEDLDL